MLENEAKWLESRLGSFSTSQLSPIINLGSSTSDFRMKGQPYIHKHIIEPLERRGVKVIHVDLFDGEGVDISGDVFDVDVFSRIRAHNPKSIICSNILEHVANPELLGKLCFELIEDDGLVFVTVPFSFPYHLAPIDTNFRPSIKELVSIFPASEIHFGEVAFCGTFFDQICKFPIILLKQLARTVIPWPTIEHWKAVLSRYKWLFKEYKVSCVVLRKK